VQRDADADDAGTEDDRVSAQFSSPP
jgi:hypothetical protein